MGSLAYPIHAQWQPEEPSVSSKPLAPSQQDIDFVNAGFGNDFNQQASEYLLHLLEPEHRWVPKSGCVGASNAGHEPIIHSAVS